MNKYLRTDDLKPQRSLTHTHASPGRLIRSVSCSHTESFSEYEPEKEDGMNPQKDESKSDCVRNGRKNMRHLQWSSEGLEFVLKACDRDEGGRSGN